MKFIEGLNRNQISIFPLSLDATIDQDNEVRIIDLFVDSLNIIQQASGIKPEPTDSKDIQQKTV